MSQQSHLRSWLCPLPSPAPASTILPDGAACLYGQEGTLGAPGMELSNDKAAHVCERQDQEKKEQDREDRSTSGDTESYEIKSRSPDIVGQ